MNQSLFVPQRCRVIVGTLQLKSVLHDHVKLLFPTKELSEVEINEIMHSIIGSVITPLIDETVTGTVFQQASFDLIDFHLHEGGKYDDRAYDVYTMVECWIIRLVLSAIPQLTTTGDVYVVGFSVSKPGILVLDVSTNDVNNSRTHTREAKNHETPEWSFLEFGRF